MKETLYKFRLPLIIVGVALIFVVVAFMLRLAGGGGEENERYFGETLYPVTAEEQKDGTLRVTVDGSATPELSWTVSNEAEDLCGVTQRGTERNGVLTVVVTPLSTGYATIDFTRETEVMGIPVVAAGVHLDCIISETEEDGSLFAAVSEIYQDAAYFGAADTDTPYILEGNRIRLPGDGDWEITEVTAGDYDYSVVEAEETAEASAADDETDAEIILPEGMEEELAAAAEQAAEVRTMADVMAETEAEIEQYAYTLEGSTYDPEAAAAAAEGGEAADAGNSPGGDSIESEAVDSSMNEVLDAAVPEGAIFDIVRGVDDEGISYIDVYPKIDTDAALYPQVRFELTSKTLGITINLTYRIDNNGDGKLVPKEE